MLRERLNEKKKKKIYFSNLRIEIFFFFNLKFFLSLCLVAKKMEENNL